mgnify:CR=1 FL=1
MPVQLPLDDRTFDLVLLSNWENQIMYGPQDVQQLPAVKSETEQDANLTTPINAALESGAWTQSIIWSPKAPFRDFTQLELHEEDIVPEEKPVEYARPRKRLRTDTQIKDKFNLSNDQYYEVSKEGGRHRVRQTFGQLVVEHAYPAQKLQLPFVRILPMQPSLMSDCVSSTKLASRNKKLVLSTVLRCNSLRTSKFDSKRFEQPRRRRTRTGEGWAKVAILATRSGRPRI